MAFLARSLAALLLLVLIGDAVAHDHDEGSWINEQRLVDPLTHQWCCSLVDCREETENIKPVDGGYRVVSTGEVIPRTRVIWKSPGGWWRCRNLADDSTRCLIGPPQGM